MIYIVCVKRMGTEEAEGDFYPGGKVRYQLPR